METTKIFFPVCIQNIQATAGRNFECKTWKKFPWITNLFACLHPKLVVCSSLINSGYKQTKIVGCSRGIFFTFYFQNYWCNTVLIQIKSEKSESCRKIWVKLRWTSKNWFINVLSRFYPDMYFPKLTLSKSYPITSSK